jgi:hypothetical protein
MISNNSIIEQYILEDIVKNFNTFYEKNDPKYLNLVWKELHHAKLNNWFSLKFYQYWLMKCINVPTGQGSYVLNVHKIVCEICELKGWEFGKFIEEKINLMFQLNENENLIQCLNYGLMGGAIFEKAWIMDLMEKLEIEYPNVFLEMNSKNEFNFLESELKKNN